MSTWKIIDEHGIENNDPKLLSSNIAAVFLGRETPYQFSGSKQQSEALESALIASQQFHAELHKSTATLGTISSALKNKTQAGKDFYITTGVLWPI